MRASVIVITRNRSHSISEALEALAKQECPDFEVLVVDNSNELEKANTAKSAAAHGAKYVFEPRRGQAVARNTGISIATGEVIAFTDDDCVPEKDWLSQKVRAFSDPSVWACTGRVIQHNREGAADLFEEVAGQDLGGERRVFSEEDIRFRIGFLLGNVLKVFSKHMKSRAPVPFGMGHGSSMAFSREAFKTIGGFDERFGGESILRFGIEDIEYFYRVLESGHSLVYEPSAVVRHKHKLTADEVFKTRYIYSYTGATLMREYRKNPLMRFMFWGRLLQLLIKSTQYRLLGKKDLAASFASDLRGFRDGWSDHRRYSKANPSNKPGPLLATS
jgi:GT2 family glycosyltransferase